MLLTGRTNDLQRRRAIAVEAVVKLLQIGQVRSVDALDHPRVDRLERAELRDDPRQQDDYQIGWVTLDPRVTQWQDLVGRGGQPHSPLAVEGTFVVDVP